MVAAKTEYRKNRSRRAVKAVFRLTVFLTIVVMTLMAYRMAFDYVTDNQDEKEYEASMQLELDDAISIEIPMGSTTADIIEILESKNIIKYPYIFKLLSKINGYDGIYKSGTHLIKKDIDYNSLKGYETLMRILSEKPLDNPDVTVTIPEGYTYKQIVKLLLEKELIDEDKFEKAVNETDYKFKFIEGIPEGRKPRLEGYLFPETYKFDPERGEEEIVRKLLGQFDKVFKKEYYERAQELGMTMDQIVILASIIEREAISSEERDIISGIFYNRLKRNMRLQSCATIQYVFLNETGSVKEVLTIEDTQIDHLYNTYMIDGLPPGPICNPSEDAIKAALYPKDTNYLFFVSKGDGTHHFSRTQAEHDAAVSKYGLN
jgi:UPF0755 protein